MRRALAAAIALLALSACTAGPGLPNTGGSPSPLSPSPSAPPATPSAAPSPLPTLSPSPSPSAPAGFACRDFYGQPASEGSRVTDVRVGAHDGYDRFVIEFSGAVPTYAVERRAGTAFRASPSDLPATLAGDNGVLITISPVQDWMEYRGPTAFTPGFTHLREARQLENFEAVQQWGLGVAGAGCLRVFLLDSPSRLVVDVAG